MKNHARLSKRFGLLALVVSSAMTLYSQVAPARPGEVSRPPAEDSTVQLSPFVVNSTKDTGYQATSTLAGTRLNTPLKDLGASISVYTKDLLDDIGATNSNDLLRYATGMDASGPGGNFSGTGADINTIVPVPEASREDPQGTSRSRGLSAPSFTRDFFNSTIDMDTYNTERVTVLRGPNAALIGVSSPAGVTDTSLIRADVQRNTHKVVARYGNNNSWRTTMDFNRVIIPGKLAARLAGLEAREEYNQRPAYERKERIFGAVTYQPYKSTVVRGNFESGRMRANRPDTILPGNNISDQWYAAGRPGFDWTFYDDPARNPNAANQNAGNFLPFYMGQLALAGPDQIIYNNPDDRNPSYIYQGRIGLTNANAVNALKDQLFHPTLNRDMAQDNPRFRHTLNIWEQPAGAFWVGGNVLPGQLPGLIPPGLKQQGFSDFSVFDFENRMLDETGLFTDDFHAFNVSLEQHAWDNRLGIELSYDEQRLDRASRLTFNRLRTRAPDADNQIRLDVNLVQPTGLPNPNYGRPFVMARGNRSITRNNKDSTVRATGYLKYDFKDVRESWAKWLGRHTLSGVLEQFRRDTIFAAPEQRSDGPAPRVLNTDPFARNPTRIVYVGPSLIGNNNPLRINPIKVPQVISGPLGNIAAFERPGDLVTPGGFVDSPYSLAVLNSSGQLAREVIKSRAATLQSYWLQDHIVTLFGWRRDTDYFAKRDTTFVFNPATPGDFGKVIWGFEDFTFPRTPPRNVSKDARSYSVVARWPQRLFRLPAGSDFSVFYNSSENFTPVGGRVDFFNRPLAVPEGDTKEYGFNFSMFGDKLGLRVNRFETNNTGVSYSSGAIFGTIQAPQTMYTFWVREGNINPQLVALANAQIATLLAPLPSNYLQLYNVTVSGTAPNISVSSNPDLPGAADTTDYAAKGVEIELVYNPTSNWRIMANLAKQETIKSNTLPFTKAFAALMAPAYRALAGVPGPGSPATGGSYPPGYVIGTPLPPNIETVAQYIDRNSLVPLASELASEGFPAAEQRKWRVNIVSNYSFGRGSIFGERLRGWSIGGGLRWQSRFILGFPSSRNPDGSARFDRSRPYYGPAEWNIDAWVGYGRKIWADRIDWRVQLNAVNLYDSYDKGVVPISVQPWGQYATYRLAPEKRWYLTNTFSF